jgi:CysZ protein
VTVNDDPRSPLSPAPPFSPPEGSHIALPGAPEGRYATPQRGQEGKGKGKGSAGQGTVRDFFAGAAFVGRGLRMWATSPRLMFLGVIPAIIVGVLYAAALIVLAFNLDAIAIALTPFADKWGEPFRLGSRIAAATGVAGVTLLIVIATYTALTLAIGDPFYERIWRRVEERLGGIPDEFEMPLWRSIRVGIVDSSRLVMFAALVGILLFAGGFIPVVGQTLVPVLAATTAGWVLAVELTGRVFDARGISPSERRRVLKRSRALSLGFGVTTYLLFLIPLGAILVMPAAVAGATLLGREALDRNPVTASTTGKPRTGKKSV